MDETTSIANNFLVSLDNVPTPGNIADWTFWTLFKTELPPIFRRRNSILDKDEVNQSLAKPLSLLNAESQQYFKQVDIYVILPIKVLSINLYKVYLTGCDYRSFNDLEYFLETDNQMAEILEPLMIKRQVIVAMGGWMNGTTLFLKTGLDEDGIRHSPFQLFSFVKDSFKCDWVHERYHIVNPEENILQIGPIAPSRKESIVSTPICPRQGINIALWEDASYMEDTETVRIASSSKLNDNDYGDSNWEEEREYHQSTVQLADNDETNLMELHDIDGNGEMYTHQPIAQLDVCDDINFIEFQDTEDEIEVHTPKPSVQFYGGEDTNLVDSNDNEDEVICIESALEDMLQSHVPDSESGSEELDEEDSYDFIHFCIQRQKELMNKKKCIPN